MSLGEMFAAVEWLTEQRQLESDAIARATRHR